MASSIILLPDVFAVISKPSRIGTPEAINVLKVRVNLATATFLSNKPKTGIFSNIASVIFNPFSVFRKYRKPITAPIKRAPSKTTFF